MSAPAIIQMLVFMVIFKQKIDSLKIKAKQYISLPSLFFVHSFIKTTQDKSNNNNNKKNPKTFVVYLTRQNKREKKNPRWRRSIYYW